MDADARQEIELILAHAPGWLVYVVILLAALAAWWGFRRYGPTAPGVWGLLARISRATVLALLVLLVSGPSWRRTSSSSLPGRLLILVDSSASMAREDGPDERTRIALADDLAAALDEVEANNDLLISWRAIASGDPSWDPAQPRPATGTSSRLGEELEESVLGLSPDAVILLSDGRVTAGTALASAGESLIARGLPPAGIWVLGVGGHEIEGELLIDDVDAPAEAPLRERVPLRIALSARALQAEQPIRIQVRDAEERILAETELAPGAAADPETISPSTLHGNVEVILDRAGEQRLQVEVSQGDLRASASLAVQVRERRLQVLMLAHRPRWELRYLREALQRDHSVTLHSYLADGHWRRWGDARYGPARPPLDATSLRDYDAVILGDLGPDRFEDVQLETLAAALRREGMGLVWLPGEFGSTAAFAPTTLGRLLPVDLPAAATIRHGFQDNLPRSLRRTAWAAERNLLPEDEVPWAELPELRGACPVVAVRPGANVLLEDAEGQPLVVIRDFGAGKALFVGFDDSWRWRREVGDRHLHRYWSQLLRYVSLGRSRGTSPWRLVPSPRRAAPGEQVRLALTAANPQAELEAPTEATVRLSAPDGREQLLRLHRPVGEAGLLATLPAPGPGGWRLEIVDGLPPDEVAGSELLVVPPADERRDPRRDDAALSALAQVGGGRAVLVDPGGDGPAAVAELLAAMPRLARERSTTSTTALWDRPIVFLLLLLFFAIDWAIRRHHRLP